MKGEAALHATRHLLGIDKAWTQTTAAERHLLSEYARGRTSLLEIGVFEGVSTRVIAEAMPATSKLVAVDPFFPGAFGVCWSKLVARREASRASGKQVHFVELLSRDAFDAIQGDFDFIFIDADHSLEGITTDWTLWSQRCSVGGVVALHDTRATPASPQVTRLGSFRYYNEVIRKVPSFREVASADSLSIVERVAA